MSESKQRFLQIDEDGYLKANEARITDEDFGQEIFENLHFTDFGALASKSGESEVFIEAFDEPLVVKNLERQSEFQWRLNMPYGFQQELQILEESENLTLDEWDRFHGLTRNGLPFVFSRAAQAEFFNQLEDFDDTGIYLGGRRFEIPDWLKENNDIDGDRFWTGIYESEKPRWELEQPAPALKDVLPQLKIPRAKVLVLGCGSGNDAAHLANAGHIVSAVDISPVAIQQAQEKFGNVRDLSFTQADVFNLPPSFAESFDLIFEHTCFCAINPVRRNELMNVWKKCLRPSGQVLGLFFVHPKRKGPPYGGSEWELRQRFKKKGARILYWTRWKHSLPRRMGKELVAFVEF